MRMGKPAAERASLRRRVAPVLLQLKRLLPAELWLN
jgi:hypothetical protein